MHPLTLAAVLVLVVNDWLLKPRWRTGALHDVAGKLSDIAGLVFAPVVLTAAIGLVLALASRLGARVDPSLSHRRLLACIAATGVGFAAVKLSPEAADVAARALSHLGRPASFSLDRTDLFCLPALAVAWWIGRDELRRVPLGKVAAVHRLHRPAAAALIDTRAAGTETRELAAAIDSWDVAQIDTLLGKLGRRERAT